MSKVRKLTADQYRSLEGLTLEEKLEKLIEWKRSEEVTLEQMNYFSNLWITRAMKKKLPEQPKVSLKARTVVEGEMNKLIDDLRNRIATFVTKRKLEDVKLSEKVKEAVRKYLDQYRYLPKIDELLVLGLRYPDKDLNTICAQHIKAYKLGSTVLWVSLWRDDLVPLDAVRLMLDGGNISSKFSQSLVSRLLPLMKEQQEKEIIRLVWAKSNNDGSNARKEGRIAEFNRLINAAEAYINS